MTSTNVSVMHPAFSLSSAAAPFWGMASSSVSPCRFTLNLPSTRYAFSVKTPRVQPSCCQQPSLGKPDNSSHSDLKNYATVEKARLVMAHALETAHGDVHAVARSCALGFVDAFCQCYPPDDFLVIFIVVGHGFTGLVGLYIAEQLKNLNYQPIIYASCPSKYIDVRTFCDEKGLSLSDFVPSTLSFYYNVVIDALMGIGYDGTDIRDQFWPAFQVLFTTDLPVASVDVPSGWDLTLGPRSIDLTADTFIKPSLLVSLAVPKLCSKRFKGEFHFIAGRHVSQQWLHDQGLCVPRFPGPDARSVLFWSNSSPFRHQQGEIYDRPGTFNATLYTNNPRRKWVDVEEDDELWDELD